MANNLTFIDSALILGIGQYDVKVKEPEIWDRQTLAILYYSDNVKHNVMNSIRSAYKPTSHSEGTGYEIDVYTNLNYSINEKDPAMRNIRVVYCDMNILTFEGLNSRFPNSYMIIARKKRKRGKYV